MSNNVRCPYCGSTNTKLHWLYALERVCFNCSRTFTVMSALERDLRANAIRRAGGVSALHTMARARCVRHTDALRAEAAAREEAATPMTEGRS
ncbi:MAG: hypothetical protein PHE83_17960 [Opitutaceae bacterium]|nr:hypothetical protein [Opitutaceae bacterium]